MTLKWKVYKTRGIKPFWRVELIRYPDKTLMYAMSTDTFENALRFFWFGGSYDIWLRCTV